MKRFKCRNLSMLFLLVVSVFFAITTATINAATIFESGTLGPTGIPQGSVAATNVSTSVYTGVRFRLDQPVLTTQIGGHFVGRNNDTFFGAIVVLDDESDFPDSGDLSTPDVLGSTELTFPVPSAEVFGDLSLTLEPGWYALVFGSGLFGTSGNGAAPRNNTDIGDPTYIAFQPSSAFGWVNFTTTPNRRFVVKGQIVPEASSIILLSTMSLFVILRRRSRWS